ELDRGNDNSVSDNEDSREVDAYLVRYFKTPCTSLEKKESECRINNHTSKLKRELDFPLVNLRYFYQWQRDYYRQWLKSFNKRSNEEPLLMRWMSEEFYCCLRGSNLEELETIFDDMGTTGATFKKKAKKNVTLTMSRSIEDFQDDLSLLFQKTLKEDRRLFLLFQIPKILKNNTGLFYTLPDPLYIILVMLIVDPCGIPSMDAGKLSDRVRAFREQPLSKCLSSLTQKERHLLEEKGIIHSLSELAIYNKIYCAILCFWFVLPPFLFLWAWPKVFNQPLK
ncbi:MAG: hypothetical protein VW378_03360, partial [bacterium]